MVKIGDKNATIYIGGFIFLQTTLNEEQYLDSDVLNISKTLSLLKLHKLRITVVVNRKSVVDAKSYFRGAIHKDFGYINLGLGR